MKYQSGVFAAGAAAAFFFANGAVADFNNPIVGGEQISSPSDYPWMVSLQLSGSRHNCGGFLIQNNVVMTAAHCIGSTYAGITVKGVGLTASGGEFYTIKNTYKHEGFSSVTAGKDIALLELNPNSAGEFTSVTPVAWDQGEELHVGKTSRAIGWGRLSAGGSAPTNLQQVDLPVRTNEDCAKGYGSRVRPDMVCAGVDEGGIDSCQGDSGGPLFIDFDTATPTVIGVVSWGEGCARPNKLGVYARISELKAWVNEKLAIINAVPTNAPTTSPTITGATNPPVAVCEDSPVGFYDVDGPTYTCEWYATGNRCAQYGSSYNNPTFDNKNANQACCVCGGGTTGRASEDVVRLAAPTCSCDDGPGYFDKCAYSLPFLEKAVCILAHRGGASMKPKCVLPSDVELKFSSNYNRWVAIGCTPQPRSLDNEVIPYETRVFEAADFEQAGDGSNPDNGTPDNTNSEGNPVIFALGGAAGGVAASAMVAGAIMVYNKNKPTVPSGNTNSIEAFRVNEDNNKV